MTDKKLDVQFSLTSVPFKCGTRSQSSGTVSAVALVSLLSMRTISFHPEAFSAMLERHTQHNAELLSTAVRW